MPAQSKTKDDVMHKYPAGTRLAAALFLAIPLLARGQATTSGELDLTSFSAKIASSKLGGTLVWSGSYNPNAWIVSTHSFANNSLGERSIDGDTTMSDSSSSASVTYAKGETTATAV